jgi:hypothetical protein
MKELMIMPCNGGNYFGQDRVEYRESPQSKQAIDLLTRRLCFACARMQDHEVPLGSELDEWWYEHQLRDKALQDEAKQRANQELAQDRRERYLESVKERVLVQLTDDEKEALGIRRNQ